MFRSTRASSTAPSSTFLLTLTCFILAGLVAASAQANPTEVTKLTFTQRDLPLGTASYNNGCSSSIITGDFNNDGILDVVTIEGDIRPGTWPPSSKGWAEENSRPPRSTRQSM